MQKFHITLTSAGVNISIIKDTIYNSCQDVLLASIVNQY